MARRSQVAGRRSEKLTRPDPTSDPRPATREIVELVKDFRFEAAHFLPNVAEGHKCRRMHGHSFRGEVAVRGPVDEKTGWLMDFADLKRVVDPLVARLDHYLLNQIDGLQNPTSERLAVWFWERLAPSLPLLHRVTIEETCSSRCHYFGGRGSEGADRKI